MAKKIKITSPKGIAKYAWLTKPSTKFKPEGEYQVSLLLDPEDEVTKAFIATIDGYVNESLQAAQNNPDNKKYLKRMRQRYPYQMEVDDEGEETGKLIVKFKKAASFKDKDTGEVVRVTIPLFDAKGKPTTLTSVFSGSVIRVNANVGTYFSAKDAEAGITLYINAVQVIKAQNTDGSSYGFGNEADDVDDETEGTGGEGGMGGEETSEENPDF